MNKEKSIYDLELHESVAISQRLCVTRVPNGWIYLFLCLPENIADFGVFVPWHNEFKHDTKPEQR